VKRAARPYHGAAARKAGTQHVVVVDEGDLSLRLIGSIAAEIPGIIVHPFTSSPDAIAQCRDVAVDCFIIDHYSHASDGLEMIRKIRAIPAFSLVPIVMITNAHERGLRLRSLAAGANDVIQIPIDRRDFFARLSMHLSLQAARKQRFEDLEAALRDEGARNREQANRLAALWRVAHNSLLDGHELFLAMLREGALGLRDGEQFSAIFGRLEGSEIVAEALFNGGLAPEQTAGISLAGHRFELEGSTFIEMLRGGVTQSWTDTARDPVVPCLKRLSTTACRSIIMTPVHACGSSHFLSFSSLAPLGKAFTAEDHAYVELLATFFATQLHARWQSDRIRYQCEHDPLTDLRTRAHFRSAGRLALLRDGCAAIAVVNIDHFRSVNEMYGCMLGDAILVEVGAALAQRAEGDELVARLDGDSFGIFFPGVRSRDRVERRVAAFAAAFEHPFSTGDSDGKLTISVTATAGVAIAPDDGTTFEEILGRAEAAVSASKAGPRGRITFFTTDMEGQEQWRTRLTNELRKALERDEFVLHFQPHIDLTTGRASGAEALIRWNHPIRGLLPPSEFIPFAEEHGLIKAIGSHVFRQSIAAAEILGKLDPAFRLYFNLSPVQLEDDRFTEELIEAGEAGAPLNNLGVEITETAAMRDVQTTLRLLGTMREHGLNIAIDDFGVGYSSLSLLKLLPLNIVKIDGSFIRAILDDPHDAIVVEGIISIVKKFGSLVLAEGVETLAQLDWLAAKGCRYVQGFALCPGLPLAEFLEWLRVDLERSTPLHAETRLAPLSP
jgi:diguanylate cyclase (GGDEF)-like protein